MSLRDRLAEVRGRIEAACRRVGRDPSTVRLVAVSKTKPASAIREAYEAGQRDFGENYAQELRDKMRALADLSDLRWHFIGPVQRNKVRYLAGKVALCHAIDRLEVAQALSERSLREGRPTPVLVAVHLGGEVTKHGVDPSDAPALVEAMAALPGLEVHGLFTLPPFHEAPEDTRPYFRELAGLRARLATRGRNPMPELSMGMSHDFEVAIEEGATLVRVGTALFGARTR